MKKFLIVLVSLASISEGVIYSSIPEHLLECYRGGGPPLGAPRRLDVFLSLLKKLELHSQSNMRGFSTALLFSLRLDGVDESANAVETEFVTPYRASGFQFYKYKLLMDLMLPTGKLPEVDEILSTTEKCLLHQMLSGTVRQWERGDEDVVCPLSIQQTHDRLQIMNETRLISRCPIEGGVIKTEWGTISPGTLVAAIASKLEHQRVAVTEFLNADVYKADLVEPLIASAKAEWYTDIETLNDDESQRTSNVPDISNLWVATLAGDLAEVVVNQGPRVGSAPQNLVVGSSNRWNDTMLPRNYYLHPQNREFSDWHFTDAELLAGIDGLILANYTIEWIEKRNSLKLSEVIDMYYSNEGVAFEPRVKACNRRALFSAIFNSSELITETSRFAHVLYLLQGGVYISNDKMNRISQAAVTAFMDYLPLLFSRYNRECVISHDIPAVDLIVATDGSWKGYDVEQFVSWVGGAFDIDLSRSTLGLLHGNTGQWIAPPASNLTTIFEQINKFKDQWPNRMNVPNVISRILQHSQEEFLRDNSITVGRSTVVLIVSPNDRPSANEVERARELMNLLRTTYFDVYFAYAAQELTGFQNINNMYLDYSERFLETESTSVTDVVKVVDTYLVKSKVPKRIVGAQCPFNDTIFDQTPYEDFVQPSREQTYRIHPFYLRQQALINIQIQNSGQGQLLVCMWRGADASHSCQTIPERETYSFNLTTPCPSIDFCVPANFIITATSTENLCANNDCRFPNEVGYYIRQTGLQCLPLRGSAISTSLHWTLNLLLNLTLSLMFIA